MQSLRIGDLARRAGVPVDTVRYYEREGLIPEPPRRPSGYREYPPDAVTRLRFIRRAKELGFSLTDVSELLRLQSGRGTRAEVRKIAVRREQDLGRRIAELTRLRDALRNLSHRCSGQGNLAGCPIIESLIGDKA